MKADFRIQTLLGRHLAGYNEPSDEQVTAATDRVWQSLGRKSHDLERVTAASPFQERRSSERERGRSKPLVAFAAAAVLVIAAVGTAILWRPAENALFHVAEGNPQWQHNTVRSGGVGAVLALLDGSRVEMRSNTELAVEHADDGVRIRLKTGGIIVNAARQRSGRLYVQTKDVTVSVVGTVFFVNAEEQGSRVAVLEGEVHVQQGTTEKKLLPGEQVATSPAMASPPIAEGIAWSRDVLAHAALLQQSTTSVTTTLRQNAVEERVAFEEASIRPSAPALAGGGPRGGGPGSCSGQYPTVDPGRFAVTNETLYTLIGWAYGMAGFTPSGCINLSKSNLILDVPGWVRTDKFDIQALIPQGSAVYTTNQLRRSEVPNLQRMLRTLLEERFKLVVRRETRQMPVYVLSAEQGAPKPYVPDGIAADWLEDKRTGSGVGFEDAGLLWARRATMAELVVTLSREMERPVLDRTRLAGEFSFWLEYTPFNYTGTRVFTRPSIFMALQEQVGLKLEGTQASLEVLVIEHVEKPSAN